LAVVKFSSLRNLLLTGHGELQELCGAMEYSLKVAKLTRIVAFLWQLLLYCSVPMNIVKDFIALLIKVYLLESY